MSDTSRTSEKPVVSGRYECGKCGTRLAVTRATATCGPLKCCGTFMNQMAHNPSPTSI